jgi:hypothetical protein
MGAIPCTRPDPVFGCENVRSATDIQVRQRRTELQNELAEVAVCPLGKRGTGRSFARAAKFDQSPFCAVLQNELSGRGWG